MDRSSSGKVEATELVRPSLRVPCPVGDGVVHERRPDECEYEEGTKSSTLSTASDREDGRDGSEHGLAGKSSLEVVSPVSLGRQTH